MNVFMLAALIYTQIDFLTQGPVHTLWSTHWQMDHAWPDSPSPVARSRTRCSAIFRMITRCCVTRCLVRRVSLTRFLPASPQAFLRFSPPLCAHASVRRRSGVSPRAAGPNSSHVCRSPAPGHARSVGRAAEDGNGAAVAAWASPARRPSTKSGGLLQVSKDPEGPVKCFSWVLFCFF